MKRQAARRFRKRLAETSSDYLLSHKRKAFWLILTHSPACIQESKLFEKMNFETPLILYKPATDPSARRAAHLQQVNARWQSLHRYYR